MRDKKSFVDLHFYFGCLVSWSRNYQAFSELVRQICSVGLSVDIYAASALEIAAVIGLVFDTTKKWSTILFISIMIGAAYTHIANAEYARVIYNGIVHFL